MAAFEGMFYGYREIVPPPPRKPPGRPGAALSPMKLPLISLDTEPGYFYFARNGQAPVDFPDYWITLDSPSRQAIWSLIGGPLDIQLTFDGETVGDTVTIRAPTTTLDCFSGYRVKQHVPGFLVWYQLIAII